jgi:hypothetical protein
VAYTATTVQDLGAAIVHSDATNSTLQVDMTGAARLAKLVVEPGLLEFRSEVGEPVVESAFVKNDGYAPLTVGIHYIDEPSFAETTATPYDLSPGESIEVPITWTPQEVGTRRAAVAVVERRRRELGTPGRLSICYGVAEFGIRARAQPDPGGTRSRTRGHDVCMTTGCRSSRRVPDRRSQDDARRRLRADRDRPDQSVTFAYTRSSIQRDVRRANAITQTTTDFWFFGAYVPEPLRSRVAADTQEVVWDEIATNPVVLVGREHSTFELAIGDSAQIDVEAMNLGRVATDADVVEHVPAWLHVVNTGDAMATAEPDGTTTLVWDAVSPAVRIDTDELDEATIYDPHYLSYTATLETCPAERSISAGPTAVWVDAGFTQRTSDGSPLIIHCDP